VNDSAVEALPVFEQALALSRRQSAESVMGIVECLQETEGNQCALQYLDQSMSPQYEPEDLCKLAEMKREIEKDIVGE
jgi:hypothetical protein